MVQHHDSMAEQLLQWGAEMIAHAGTYGLIIRLSRESGLSRPTLYALKRWAQAALQQMFAPPPTAPRPVPTLERHVLTLLVHAHATTHGS